ncbi:MAG: RpiB/LacA/LacB family sugar-phosphate isomerase [Bacteroidales bacterium]|nr:RpiB/LacA/LacB family sugar-phosphate isomerase [Bacteroidales bacterium]
MTKSVEIIAIGSDHAGFGMKKYLMNKLAKWGFEVKDFGTFSEESMDYPDPIHPLANAIEKGEYKKGIILCGSGNGAIMVANKYPHVRAALCWKDKITRLARQHNDANIISLPARFISNVHAAKLVKLFLHTEFEGGRHERRVKKISATLQS